MDEEQKRKRNRELRRKRRRRQVFINRTIFLLVVLMIISFIVFIITKIDCKVNKKVYLEAGNPIDIGSFLKKESNEEISFVTDISKIDTTQLGSYEIVLRIKNKEYTSNLIIQDTIAPECIPVTVTTNRGILPEASECVSDISDQTDVTVIYETIPDVSEQGEAEGKVLLTDAAGNKTTVDIVIHVIRDEVPPVIEGAKDIEAYVGDSISYKSNVTVTDDQDENPLLEIDNSQVDLSTAGTYEVTYIATDAAGNQSTETISVILSEKPEGYVEPDEVYALADEVLATIIDDSMSDMQKAFAIYRWVNTNIGYTGTSDKSSWTIGAYQAFTTKTGDCFNYYAAGKALLDEAGISNIDIVKSDTSHSSHYWSLINLGDGWYHFDCTPRKGTGDNFFMVTDEELEAYSSTHNNSHIFDHSLYPERATVSVQDKVDYDRGVIKE